MQSVQIKTTDRTTVLLLTYKNGTTHHFLTDFVNPTSIILRHL